MLRCRGLLTQKSHRISVISVTVTITNKTRISTSYFRLSLNDSFLTV